VESWWGGGAPVVVSGEARGIWPILGHVPGYCRSMKTFGGNNKKVSRLFVRWERCGELVQCTALYNLHLHTLGDFRERWYLLLRFDWGSPSTSKSINR